MSQVYFLLAASVNLMKIGRSVDPDTRFAQLRLLSPVPLEVFVTIDGGSGMESALHNRFAHLNAHGEWFYATEELRRFAWEAAGTQWWDEASAEWREAFLARIDQPVMDATRFGGAA